VALEGLMLEVAGKVVRSRDVHVHHGHHIFCMSVSKWTELKLELQHLINMPCMPFVTGPSTAAAASAFVQCLVTV